MKYSTGRKILQVSKMCINANVNAAFAQLTIYMGPIWAPIWEVQPGSTWVI